MNEQFFDCLNANEIFALNPSYAAEKRPSGRTPPWGGGGGGGAFSFVCGVGLTYRHFTVFGSFSAESMLTGFLDCTDLVFHCTVF